MIRCRLQRQLVGTARGALSPLASVVVQPGPSATLPERVLQGWKIPPHIPYAGRGPSASPAAGFASVHAEEQAKLTDDALDLVCFWPLLLLHCCRVLGQIRVEDQQLAAGSGRGGDTCSRKVPGSAIARCRVASAQRRCNSCTFAAVR